MNLDYHRHLEAVVAEDLDYVKKKDRQYGGSWAKRGGVGAFMMLARKWDRLEKFMEDVRYDIFQGIDLQSGELQGTDGTVLAEIRDLRRYLLLVEAKMVEAGAVELPVTAQETMGWDLTGRARENMWKVLGPHGLIEQGKEAVYFPGGGRSIQVAVLQLYADGSAEIVDTEGLGRGMSPRLVQSSQLRPLETPNPPPAAAPVPATSAGALEEAPAVGEPGGDEGLELVFDRQPRSATEAEYRAVEMLPVRRGSQKGLYWRHLYGPLNVDGRWIMHLEYQEEYGK